MCEQCRGRILDGEDVDPTYLPGCIGQNAIMQAPKKTQVEAEIRRQAMGQINPEDIDWIKLQRSPRKSDRNLQNEKWSLIHSR